jgi:peptide/nickel transport system permease protein
MKHTLQQIFRSPKFLVGFVIFTLLLLFVLIYPLFVPDNPLGIIGQGTFFEPGTYVNVFDAVGTDPRTLMLDDAGANRIASKLSTDDRMAMKVYLIAVGVDEADIEIEDTEKLLALWEEHYDPAARPAGFTAAQRRYYGRLTNSLYGLLSLDNLVVAVEDEETGNLVQVDEVKQSDFVNVNKVANVRWLPLGTDNFGRDVLTQLVSAAKTSLKIGLVAGSIATGIGLTLGLIAGYVGGWLDDIIMFITNLFTVIPGIVLLILISFSIGQENRGAVTVAVVIGITSWVWTARAVRAQVVSLRNRDHVNLSKLSGHSVAHIIVSDILPYIASYVIMAFILQISSGILAEAGLSILGLGPKTTEVPTLGLMMNWAMIYSAHVTNKWWAWVPVIVTIATISFSLNLMNTGLDQVFNPALRED